MAEPKVTVLISTHKRAHLLNYVLDALTNQTYKNFEVLVVLKPSGDGTEDVVRKYEKSLKIKLIMQTKGCVVDAVNLGFDHASGDIIAFLDDDAIPFPNWIQSHVDTYALPNVGGVAGGVIPALLNGKKVVQIKGKPSEVIPDGKPFMETIGRKLWGCPLKGLEDHLVYVSKAGMVDYNFKVASRANHQITKSLLGMGANMSVLTKALEGFRLPDSWILGVAYEQFLGWHIWRKGYNLLFNPNVKVYHLAHGQTLTRAITDKRKQTLRSVEGVLLFYRLHGLESGLSNMHRITWLIFSTLLIVKQIRKDTYQGISMLNGVFLGSLIGLKWSLSNKLGLEYNPLNDLTKL